MYFTESFTFHFTNQCHLSLVHSRIDNKHGNMEIRKEKGQMTVTRQGIQTGLNYLQQLYFQRHRPSVSRMFSHVITNLHTAGCRTQYATGGSLCHFILRIILFYARLDETVTSKFSPSQIPVESKTHTHICIHSY
jgi:hypothetical protein